MRAQVSQQHQLFRNVLLSKSGSVLKLNEVGCDRQVALKGGRRQGHRVAALVTAVLIFFPKNKEAVKARV
jgi:hypothetical protein